QPDTGRAQDVPPWLPRYDLDIHLDVDNHTVHTAQRVTWTNRHHRATDTLVFNGHSHYKVPKTDIGFFAKTLELLRMNPKEALDLEGESLQVTKASVILPGERLEAIPFHFEGDTNTDLVVQLPHPVAAGESVTVVLEHVVHLPPKMGRWGQWQG